MALFGKKKGLIEKKVETIEIDGTVYPKTNFSEVDAKSSVIGSLLQEIIELGDIDDYNILMGKSAEKFIKENIDFIKGISLISEDDIEKLTIYINNFLKEKNLGSVKLIINEEKEKLFIEHINSPFALSLKGVIDEKVCVFLSSFYSRLFSEIFEEEVSFKEIKCYCQGGDSCVFEMVR